jgi:tagatose 1,6-diphosphate aldolase
MLTLPIGKLRGLQQCASPDGTFAVLALDHRQGLRRALRPSAPASVTDEELIEFKLALTRALGQAATAVLLDPEYGAAQAIAAGCLPRSAGLVVALEATGYAGDPSARESRVLDGWSAAKARRMGASAVKLLVYYHPESATAAAIEDFVRAVAADCAGQDLPFMLEPLSYPLDPAERQVPAADRCRVVVETARRLVMPGVEILKAEFPLDCAAQPDEADWRAACAALSAASPAPWILLSAAIDFETYYRQVSVACAAGASGCAVGRAVWKEAIGLRGPERDAFLRDVARPRLARLQALCAERARPWSDFFASPPVDSRWYAA